MISTKLTKGPFLKHCHFTRKDLKEQGTNKIKLPISFELEHSNTINRDKLKVCLHILISNGDSPFELDMAVDAEFEIKGEASDDKIKELSFLEALPVIYPLAKDMVSTFTGKSFTTPVTLPQLDYNAFCEEAEPKEALPEEGS